MSRRDCCCFLAGAICALLVLVGVRSWSAADRTAAASAARAFTGGSPEASAWSPEATAATQELTATRAMPGAETTTVAAALHSQPASAAGSLEEVTRRLAARLAAGGGTDQDWRLLEQSYTYLGRTEDANAARVHSVNASAASSPHPSQPSAGQPVSAEELAAVARVLDAGASRVSGPTP